MADTIQIPFALAPRGVAKNQKVQVNLDLIARTFNQISNGELNFNQLNLGTASTTTGTLKFYTSSNANAVSIQSAAVAANRSYTIPDAGATASFVMTEGTQTVNGAKTFSSDLTVTRASVAGTVISAVSNSDNTAASASHAKALVSVGGGTTTGDPYIHFLVTGATDWSLGVDNSDSDAFCLTASTTLNGSNLLRIANGGSVSTTLPILTTDNSVSAITAQASVNGTNPRIRAMNTNGTSGQNRVGLVGAVGDNGNVEVSITAGKDSSNVNTEMISGTTKMELGIGGIGYMRVATSGHIIPLASTGTQNFGDATNYWNDISYKTLTDRGCLPWCDDGVEMRDGKVVSDLQAICAIAKHPTKKTVHGLPMLDYKTFPKKAYRQADRDGKILDRDENDEPFWFDEYGRKKPASDGVEMTMVFGVMIGAFKEVGSEIASVKKQIIDLTQRLETLEKATNKRENKL